MLPVTFVGTNTNGIMGTMQLLFNSSTTVAGAASAAWCGSAFLSFSGSAMPSLPRLGVSGGGVLGQLGATPAGVSDIKASEIPIPTNVSRLTRYECTPFVTGAATKTVALYLAFDLKAGASMNFTVNIAMPQLEKLPTPLHRATSPIINFDATGKGTTRPADIISFAGPLLAAVNRQASIAVTTGGFWRAPQAGLSNDQTALMPVSDRTQRGLLGINGLNGLQRELDGSVSSALAPGLATFRSQISNWATAQTAILTYGAGVGIASTGCGNYVTVSATASPVTTLTLGSTPTAAADVYIQQVQVSTSYISNLAPIGNVSADVIVYGAKPGGIAAAWRAASEGRSVAIMGDWREVHIGGMMANGLGATDVKNYAAYGGMPRWFVTRINQLYGVSAYISRPQDNNLVFQPRFASAMFDEILARAGIGVYWTTGVTAAPKSGTRITSLGFAGNAVYRGQTLSAKTATGKVYVGADYESDILPLAGIASMQGIDAATTFNEMSNTYSPYGGFQRAGSSNCLANMEYPDCGINQLYLDPFVKPGDPTSGLIAGVVPNPTTASPPVPNGAAMPTAQQAYNFRVNMTNLPGRKVAFPSTAPAAFDIRNFEVFLRYIKAITDLGVTYQASGGAANTTFNLAQVFLFFNVDVIADVNSLGAVSSDYIGQSAGYTNASYKDREKIWQLHSAWYQGMWYLMQQRPDSRIPAAMQADAKTFGLDILHYANDYHPNDIPNWPPQLYVRESRRMLGKFVWSLSDLMQADGTAPRSSFIIGAAAYNVDIHHTQRIAWNYGTDAGGKPLWRVFNIGGQIIGRVATTAAVPATSTSPALMANSPVGGADMIIPLPLDVLLPDPAQCSNYVTCWGISASHLAFGSFRMELTGAAAGEAAGLLAAMACEPVVQPDLQAVLTTSGGSFSYATLRSRLLTNSPVVALGGRPPVAPLVN